MATTRDDTFLTVDSFAMSDMNSNSACRALWTGAAPLICRDRVLTALSLDMDAAFSETIIDVPAVGTTGFRLQNSTATHLDCTPI